MNRSTASPATNVTTEFRQVFSTTRGSDDMFLFLQNIFHLFPEKKFHALLTDAVRQYESDQQIYETVQAKLPSIRTLLAPITYAVPALKKQKREMARQTLKLLGDRKQIDGYLEIGSTGRYVSELRKHLSFTGRLLISNDIPPSNSPADMMERGQFSKLGEFVPLDYRPLDTHGIAPESLDVITCYIGLHHCPPELLDGYARSILCALKPGGLYIMRDHDAGTPQSSTFCSLVHTVFNLGLNIPWATNAIDIKLFRSADGWAKYLTDQGFVESGPRLLQEHDPSINTLQIFRKN